jgi:hypothetical protein
VRGLAVVAALALLAWLGAGCGTSSRDAVNAYLGKVAAVQRQLAPRLSAADVAYHRLGTAGKSAKERHALARAEATAQELRRRLAALDPPNEAERIHRLTLLLADRELALSRELLALARYLPGFQAVVVDAGRAGRRLQRVLRSKPAAEAAPAFDRYASTLAVDRRRLKGLRPPHVMVPSHRSELTILVRTADLSRRLGAALERRDNASAQRLAGQLAAVSSFPTRRRAAEAEADAVRAYNDRVVGLSRLAARIQRERIRLDRDL